MAIAKGTKPSLQKLDNRHTDRVICKEALAASGHAG